MMEYNIGAYDYYMNEYNIKAYDYCMKEHPQPDCKPAAARQPIVLEWMHAFVVSYQQK